LKNASSLKKFREDYQQQKFLPLDEVSDGCDLCLVFASVDEYKTLNRFVAPRNRLRFVIAFEAVFFIQVKVPDKIQFVFESYDLSYLIIKFKSKAKCTYSTKLGCLACTNISASQTFSTIKHGKKVLTDHNIESCSTNLTSDMVN
jgi:hypothetical protein